MKKIFALVLAGVLVFSLAACGNNTEEETTTSPVTTSEVTEETPDIETTSDETEVAPVEGTTAEESSVAESTAAADESTTAAESTAPAVAAAPTTTAEIIALYNNAVNSAYNAKAGFSKERKTDNETMDASPVLSAFKSLVYQFMGVGEENKYTEEVVKRKWESETNKHYLRKSTLTASDVTGATCTVNGNQYTVVINVKGGNSKGSETEKFTNAPIDKCGICVGNEDKGYYDHKTGEVIYDAIAGTFAGAVIDEKYSNAKITAVIDGATGNLVNLTVEFDIDVNISGVGTGTATATTHIYYKNFKY